MLLEKERSCRYSLLLSRFLIYSERLDAVTCGLKNQRVFYSGGWDVCGGNLGGRRTVIAAVMGRGKKLHSRTQPCPPMPTFKATTHSQAPSLQFKGEDASSAGP